MRLTRFQPTLLRIAWRNLWRHRRRSLITATAMAVGVALCMAMMCFSDGSYAKMFDVMVEQQLGHVQVHHPAWPTKRAVYDTLPGAEAKLAAIDALPGTRAATARLIGYGLLGAAETSVGAQIVGVIPDREAAASPVDERLVAGEWLAADPAQAVVIGAGLAEELGVGVGAELVAVTQAADGSLGNALYTVRGVFKTGDSLMDKGGAYVHLQDAQALLVLPDQVHELKILSSDAESLSPYADSVRGALGGDLLVRTWWEAAPQVKQLLGMQDTVSFFMLALVFSVAGLGVVNTMLMSVFERTRELGVLKAIGLRPRGLVAMVVFESVMLAGVAAGIGLVLGGLLDVYLVRTGIDFSGAMKDGISMGGVTLDPVLKGQFRLEPVILTVLSVFLVSALAALWPALRAARLRPVESIRAE